MQFYQYQDIHISQFDFFNVDGRNSIDYPFNAIIDIFVDHRLSKLNKIPGYYDYTLQNHLETIGKISNKEDSTTFRLQVEVGTYCFIYLFSRYVLEKADKNNLFKFKMFLKNIKRRIVLGLKTKGEVFKDVDKKLDRFPKVKDTKDMREVADYLLKILYASGLWDKKEIYNVLKPHLL